MRCDAKSKNGKRVCEERFDSVGLAEAAERGGREQAIYFTDSESCRTRKKKVREIALTLISAYLRLGIRSAMPVMPAMMFPWEIMTPLGMPVEPLVYMMTAMSEDSGCLRSTVTAETEDRRDDS